MSLPEPVPSEHDDAGPARVPAHDDPEALEDLGLRMPNFGVTESDARDITTYLYTLR